MIARNDGLNCRPLRPQSLYASLRKVGQWAALFAVGVFSMAGQQLAHAASINYSDMDGASVKYTGISEASATDPVPLFGAPSVTGNSIDFNPVLFNALSQFGTPPIDLTDGKLTFMVVAHAGVGISNFSFQEAGITTVVGSGTNNTFTDVSAAGNLDISEVDGVGISVVKVPINLTFSNIPANGTWRLGADGLALSRPWTGAQFIDLNAALTAAHVPFVRGATKVTVNLDNGLIAASESGSIAFIDKKDFGGLSITVNIPEPSSMILGLAAFGLLGLIVRRR